MCYLPEDDNHDECKGIGCITDFAVIGSYGIMSTPALMVDEKIVSMGKVLKSSDIEKFLKWMNRKYKKAGAYCAGKK